MSPKSAHVPAVAAHISNLLQTPDIMFVQEIQDDTGPTDDGTVSANVTLTTLVNAIAAVSNVTYQFASIDPVNNQDGGQPGGNIRTAFLYVAYSPHFSRFLINSTLDTVPRSYHLYQDHQLEDHSMSHRLLALS